MRRLSATLVGLLILVGCVGWQQRTSSALPCRWPAAPAVLHQAADTVFLSWSYSAGQLPEHASLPDLPGLSSFLDTVRVQTGTLDPHALLQRQIGYYASRSDSDSQGEAANGQSVLSALVGTLRPITCVEALLVEFQAQRSPMASRPTEFQAVIMERTVSGTHQVRVYFAGSNAPWPPKGDLLFDRVVHDRREGWRAVAHLHNHPFLLASGGDIAGANAPSLTDVQFWQHLRDRIGVESARITNGVTTFEAFAPDFDRLQARVNRP